MSSEAFQLAILLTLKDAASSGLDRFEAKLISSGKAGEKFLGEFQKIRSELNKDLAIGGVGLAGLKLMKNGVDAAADYQSVMTDLKATIAQTAKDGHTDFNKLAADMVGAEALAVKLGNALPGTTADFAEEMQVLKQNGLDLKTILGGAGEAYAHLAVANNALPKDIAAAGAEFGNLFKLKPDEFKPAADVMSRIFTSHGQTAEELIEAAKYFQGRAGANLGLSGLKSAEDTSQLFGLFGMKGMRGSIAGTMLTDFFSEYQRHSDKIKELQQSTGIKLDFFDKKGKFAGFDTVFEQMKQFDKLSDKDRGDWMQKIFGLRGESAANVFSAEGLDGWKKFQQQQEQVVNMEDKVAMKTKTYNNQMEALQGTLTNLKVAVFEPMLPGLTSVATEANVLVGELQEFTKAHPDLVKMAVEFVGIGSAVMVAYSGVKTLTAGIRLLRIANQFSRGEGLAGMLAQTSTSLDTTGGKVDAFAKKTGRLKGDLFSLSNVFKVVLLMETIGFTWDQISKLRETIEENKEVQSGLDKAAGGSYKAYQQSSDRDPRELARSTFNLLQGGNNELISALDSSRQSWMDWYSRGVGALVGKDTELQLYKGKPTTTQLLQNPEYYSR